MDVPGTSHRTETRTTRCCIISSQYIEFYVDVKIKLLEFDVGPKLTFQNIEYLLHIYDMKILDVIESKKALLPYSGKEEQAWALDPGELVYTLDLKFQNLRSLVSLLRVFDVEPRYLSLGPKIVSLNVSTNLITTFLPLASKFPNLRHVNASLNQLETLEGLSSLAECRHLNVANNYLHEFRSLRESLPHLTFLDASFNQLDTLHTNPDVLTFLPPTLVELRLVGNVHLHTVRGISKACPNLNILHLQKNKLVDIDPLAGMTSLRELSVASNHISDLTQVG